MQGLIISYLGHCHCFLPGLIAPLPTPKYVTLNLYPTCCYHHIHPQMQNRPCQCPLEKPSVIFFWHTHCFPLLLHSNINHIKVCDYHITQTTQSTFFFPGNNWNQPVCKGTMFEGRPLFLGRWWKVKVIESGHTGTQGITSYTVSSLINSWKNWGSERVCDLSTVTEKYVVWLGLESKFSESHTIPLCYHCPTVIGCSQ